MSVDEVDVEDAAPQASSRSARGSRRGRGSWARDAHEQMLEELNAQAADDDEELDVDEDELEQQPHAAQASAFAQQFYAGPTDFAYHNRSYDDEDEALQAALKASMADLPPDFVLPELKPKEPLPRPAGSVSPPTLPTQAPEPVPDDEEYATAEEEEEEIEEDDDDAPAQELSPGELAFSAGADSQMRSAVRASRASNRWASEMPRFTAARRRSYAYRVRDEHCVPLCDVGCQVHLVQRPLPQPLTLHSHTYMSHCITVYQEYRSGKANLFYQAILARKPLGYLRTKYLRTSSRKSMTRPNAMGRKTYSTRTPRVRNVVWKKSM